MSYTYFNISDKLRLYEFEGLLDQYGDATAAYSLRKLRNDYTGSAIRVRRSSDNAERDMGFYDNELDTVALLDWVNQEVNIADYNVISNVGNTIATKIAPFTYNATSDGNGGSTIRPKISFTTTTAGNSYQLIITPSNQSGTINFKLYDGSSYIITGNDLSAGIDTTFTANGGVFIAFNGTQIFNVDFTIELNALSADGHVQTWYDQSANANHAVQNTDTAQPKIVDAGTLVTDNGSPSIVFDGVDDFLKSTLPGIPEGTDHTVSAVTNHNGTIGCYFENGKGYNGRYFNADNSGYYSVLSINGTYNYTSSLNTNFTTNQQVNVISVATNSATNYDVYVNNTSETGTKTTSVPVGTNETYIGQQNRPQDPKWWTGDIQEIVFWSVDQTDSVDDIEQNTNTYYNIY